VALRTNLEARRCSGTCSPARESGQEKAGQPLVDRENIVFIIIIIIIIIIMVVIIIIIIIIIVIIIIRIG